jgi:hypothetical protein
MAFSAAIAGPGFAAGMDGHWSGMLSGSKGSGQAEIVVAGKDVTYSYQGSQVPVTWSKTSKSTVSFGNKLFKLTLKNDGSAKFESEQFGDAAGTLSKQ